MGGGGIHPPIRNQFFNLSEVCCIYINRVRLFPDERGRKHLRKLGFLFLTDRLATGEGLILSISAKTSDLVSKQTFEYDEVNTVSN